MFDASSFDSNKIFVKNTNLRFLNKNKIEGIVKNNHSIMSKK